MHENTVNTANMNTAPASTSTALIRIQIPQELLTHFEILASVEGRDRTPEALIAEHLAATRDFTDGEAGVYLRKEDALELRRLLGNRVNTGSRILDMVRRLLTWKVGGASIELNAARAEAVTFWCKSMQRSPKEGIPVLVDQALGMLLKC